MKNDKVLNAIAESYNENSFAKAVYLLDANDVESVRECNHTCTELGFVLDKLGYKRDKDYILVEWTKEGYPYLKMCVL